MKPSYYGAPQILNHNKYSKLHHKISFVLYYNANEFKIEFKTIAKKLKRMSYDSILPSLYRF
jgi:hypothetical protein